MVLLRHWCVTYKLRCSRLKNTMEFMKYGLGNGEYKYIVYNHFLDVEREVTKQEGNDMYKFIKRTSKYVKVRKVV